MLPAKYGRVWIKLSSKCSTNCVLLKGADFLIVSGKANQLGLLCSLARGRWKNSSYFS